MKRIQCTKCGQVYWTELQVDEALIRSGEWIQNPCPRCGAEWAFVEPGTRRPRAIGRKRAKRTPTRRVPRKKEALPGGENPLLTPARIRSLRRKLGMTQKDLAALTKVSAGAVVNWERGKFKPKKDKISQLTGLMKLGKEEVKNLLAQNITKQPEEKKTEEAQVEKAKWKRKKRTTRKAVPLPKGQKS